MNINNQTASVARSSQAKNKWDTRLSKAPWDPEAFLVFRKFFRSICLLFVKDLFHYSILTVLTLRCKQTKLPPVSNAHCSCYNYEYLLFFARVVIGSLKIATCRRNTKYIKVFWLAVFSSPAPPPPSSYARWLHLSVLVCMRKDCHGLAPP